jgi:hypothetical protein
VFALKKSIVLRKSELRRHSIFTVAQASQSTEFLVNTARALAWWPFVFQDVLRLTTERTRGSGFEHFVDYHRDENCGHERWFLDDLRTLGVGLPSLQESFGEEFEGLRDACYSLLSQAQCCESGAQHVAFLLMLQATGHVFFEELSAAMAPVCLELPLHYFVRSHSSVGKDYSLFGESIDSDLDQIVLSSAERAKCEEIVQRVHQVFVDIFSHVAARALGEKRAVSHVRELQGTKRSVRQAGGS